VAALLWITLLFIVAKLPGVHTGVQQATTNWWYSHNVLGLWFTPVSVGAIYFLPKIIGRPVRSYNLSPGLLDAGLLLRPGGRPPPGGRAGAGLADHAVHRAEHDDDHPGGGFSINMAGTMRGACTWRCYSPTLRFMMFGGFMYMLSSLQGSFEALRSVNQVAHFTHFTVAHAPGAYAFVTMVLFGAIYFMLPRVLHWEWPYPRLISLQFWLAAIGIGIYFVGLTIGGWLQGLAMLDAAPLHGVGALTIPYLQWRSVGGALMVLSHLVSSATSWPWRCASARAHGRGLFAPRPRPWRSPMENEVKLAAGAMVTLAIAVAALVVLPYIQVRDVKPPEASSPTPARSCAGARSTSPTAACTATAAAARPQPRPRP
jgi:cytochrome c oxidase cbb3-type subunit 1